MRRPLGIALLVCFGCGTSVSPDLGAVPAEDTDDSSSAVDAAPAICDEQSFEIERTAVNLMITLDMSGSMAGPKYTTAREAITSVIDSFAGSVIFGFDPYPDDFAVQSCSVDGPVAFDCAPGNEAQIVQWLDSHEPVGGAGDPLVRQLEKFLTDPGYAPNFIAGGASGASYLVVVADGDDCCGPNGTYNCAVTWIDEVAARTADLLAQGIKTIPVGYTANADPATMNAVAQNGGTSYTSYIPAEDAAALEAALTDIAGAVASCSFAVDDIDWIDPELVNVYVDGELVELDTGCASGQGWTWSADGTELVLCDGPCEALASGAAEEVKATFGCPSAIVE